jgi:hypothetical protein
MQQSTQNFYVQELKLQSDLAMHSYRQVVINLRVMRADNISEIGLKIVMPLIFKEIHSFLTHSSNVSKIFWPEVSGSVPRDEDKRNRRQRTIDRGDYLRTLYNIPSGSASPLWSRELRNHLEHFDERLDNFLYDHEINNAHSPRVDMNIGPLLTPMSGFAPTSILRNFDDMAGTFSFRGEEYDLTPLALAVKKIFDLSSGLLP